MKDLTSAETEGMWDDWISVTFSAERVKDSNASANQSSVPVRRVL